VVVGRVGGLGPLSAAPTYELRASLNSGPGAVDDCRFESDRLGLDRLLTAAVRENEDSNHGGKEAD
jgi:hypothetical protein